MAMTSTHFNEYQALGQAGDMLDDKVATYLLAQGALVAAQATRDAAVQALDVAWADFKSKSVGFGGSMLTPPAGYTPPV